ncbi:LRRN4 C-terminal-like protein Precursor [Channa argus]|uniref:LRRN4 C-terminal-like protein n=1 Tax=Channa argus TaxID=215402 RepID=A0A6G1QUT4_CHAAH|nr:LRRN4 C-terminal-like protein Precursor [Channa argus]KAK2881798.1 hypothetical protein Q8A73_022308 [Channa argus]
MAVSRDLSFPLVCLVFFFIRGYSPLPTTSQVTGTNPMNPLKPSMDYDELDDPVTPIVPKQVSPHEGRPHKCDYDPCLENHTTCDTMATSTGCRCRGSTPYNVAPEAPPLKSVSWNGSEVTIQWCAPYSHVTAYVVTKGGKEWQTFGKDQRSGAVGNIDHVTQICVIAVNDYANSSESCMMYRPRNNSLPLKAGRIGGALGFLFLLLLQ